MPGWMTRVNQIIRAIGSHNLLCTPSLALFENPEIADLLRKYPLRELVTRGEQYGIWVDRPRARFSAWYELFPRSTGGWDADGQAVHGTFATTAKAIPRVAAMGFDVLYLPPVHPIGKVHRKGPNNNVTAAPGDVGSPWAIGSDEGGHDAVHPDLGTIAEFDDMVAAARDNGLEVALDLALQCAPDHPWAKDHPEWFTVLPDGTIAYAENPPKKYQDIYPLNFDNDPAGLYDEVLRGFATQPGVPGTRVRVHPPPGGDIFDSALAGRVATIASVERDLEDRVHYAVTIDDDPGRDLGAAGWPGHRFFFSPEEVEPA
mgnify:CR=1 FL=1